MSEEEITNIKKRNSLLIPIVVAVILLTAVIVIVIVVVSSPSKGIDDKLALGDRYLSEMDYDKAIAAYREVLDIDTENVNAYIGIAKAYDGQGKTEDALTILEEGYTIVRDERLISMTEELRTKLAKSEDVKEDDNIPVKKEESSPTPRQKTEAEIENEYEDLFDFAKDFLYTQVSGGPLYITLSERQALFCPMIERMKQLISDPEVFYEGCSWYHYDSFIPEKAVIGISRQASLLSDGIGLYISFGSVSNIPTIDECYALLYYWQMIVHLEDDALKTREEYAELIHKPEMCEEGYTYDDFSGHTYVLDKYGRELSWDNHVGLKSETLWGEGICFTSKVSYQTGYVPNVNSVDSYNYTYDAEGRIVNMVVKGSADLIDSNMHYEDREEKNYQYGTSGIVIVQEKSTNYTSTGTISLKLDRFGRELIDQN